MTEILYGRWIAEQIRKSVREEVAEIVKSSRPPLLAVVIAGDDEASIYYAGLIEKIGQKEGINVSVKHIREADTRHILDILGTLNANPEVDAVLIQLPLPASVDRNAVFGALSPEKDADGQTPVNLGKLVSGQESIVPATARAVLKLLTGNGIGLSGQEAVVIGRSTAVGLPTALLLTREDATVTLCHTRTSDLKKHTQSADILVVSAGVPGFIGAGDVKPGASVIDVGTSRVGEEIVGDVRFDEVLSLASASPVKGGVGAVTLACLLENTVELYRKNIQRQRA